MLINLKKAGGLIPLFYSGRTVFGNLRIYLVINIEKVRECNVALFVEFRWVGLIEGSLS